MEKLKKEKLDNDGQIVEFQQQISKNDKNLKQLISDSAKEIKDKLKLPAAYTATQIKNDISNNHVPKNIIDENKLNDLIKFITDPTEKASISTADLKVIIPNIEEIKNALNKKITPSSVIERLNNNLDAKKWVETGKDLHKDTSICFFCGEVLAKNFNEKLDIYFSKEDNEFKQQILNLKSNLKSIDIELPRTDQLFKDLQDKYTKVKDDYNGFLKNYNAEIEKLKYKLQEKLDNRDKSITLETNYNFLAINEYVNNLKTIILEHNAKAENFQTQIANGIKTVKGHYIKMLLTDKRYENSLKAITDAKKAIKRLREQIVTQDKRINEINEKISESHKGAEKINNTLNELLMHNSEISIEVIQKATGEEILQLKRSGNIANYLSEGEKSSIAFAHFMANLENKEQIGKKQNTILFIDDPISSLDQNHIFSVYSCIQDLKIEQNGYKQIFISTHNYELYRHLIDICKNKRDKDGNIVEKNKVFYVARTGTKSIITNIPNSLKKHKSEYNFMFSKLKKYSDEKNGNDFFLIGHCARRVLEIFTSAKRPIAEDFRSKIESLAKEFEIEPTICHTVYKIVNVESHTFFGKEEMDKSYISDAIIQVFEFMEKVDKSHYDCLVKNYEKVIKEESELIQVK